MLVPSQKGIVHLGLLILLLLGIVTGVYLVQHPQIFKSKATGDLIWLIDENGNKLSPKDGDIYEVDKPQIRIKINQPDWSSQPQTGLPNLVTVASAQSSPCDGDIYSCSDIKCPNGSPALGTGCYEKGGDLNNRYSTECLRNCPVNPASNIQPTQTPVPPQVTKGIICASINGQCGDSEWKLRGSGATCSGSNRSYKGYNDGDNYTDCDTLQGQYPYCYTGCETAGGAALTTGTCRSLRPDETVRPPTDPEPVDSSKYIWKAIDCNRPCTINSNCPQIDNGINPETSNWCYGFEGGERCLQLQYIGTPRGGEALPTQPTEAQPTPAEEATQIVRISLNPTSIRKDGSCSESSDPAQTCKEISALDLSAKGDIIDWQLPAQPGTYLIYIGFISNMGNYKPGPPLTVTYKPKAGTSSGKKIVVIMANFNTDSSFQPYTAEDVRKYFNEVFTPYFNEVSYDKFVYDPAEIDIFGWYNIDSSIICNELKLRARDAAWRDGKLIQDYRYEIYLFPNVPELATCSRGETIGDKYFVIFQNYLPARTIIHEFGHLLGLGHSTYWSCNGNTINSIPGTWSNCEDSDYGDYTDPMGGGARKTFHFNAPHKIQLGWLNEQDNVKVVTENTVQDVCPDRICTIVPLEEVGGDKILSIKIPKADTAEYYYLSYRQPIGLDANLPVIVTKGLTMHVWDRFGSTHILDLNPSNRSSDPVTGYATLDALGDGEVFKDCINKISIQQTSHDVRGVRVRISFGDSVGCGLPASERRRS